MRIGLVLAVVVALPTLGPPDQAHAAADVRPVTSATIVHESWNLLDDWDASTSAQGPGAVRATFLADPEGTRRTLVLDVRPQDSRPESAGSDYSLEFVLPPGHEFEAGTTYARPRPPAVPVEHPVGMELGFGSTGCDGYGELTVHEVDPDAGRLWVTFVLWCYAESDGATYGEVRVGVDAPTAQGLVAPALASWPEAEVGETADVAAWAVQNPTGSPATLGTPYVTGPDAADFVLRPLSCQVVAAQGRCHVSVLFTPGGAGPREAVLHVPTEGGAELTVDLRGSGVGGNTSFQYYGRSPYNAGYAYDEGPSAQVYVRTTWENGIVVATRRYSGYHGLFRPPTGETLQVGRRYTGVRWTGRGSSTGVASMDTGLTSNDCTDFVAEFTVHELTFDAAGRPASLSVDFDVLCSDWDEKPDLDLVSRGAFAWRAAAPAPRIEVGPLAPGPVDDDPEPETPPTTTPSAPPLSPVSPPVATTGTPLASPSPGRPVIRLGSDRRRYSRGAVAEVRLETVRTSGPVTVELQVIRGARGERGTAVRRLVMDPSVPVVLHLRVRQVTTLRAAILDDVWARPSSTRLRVRDPRRGAAT